jgi:DNA repair exonuclease SbcCD nuclease subunit
VSGFLPDSPLETLRTGRIHWATEWLDSRHSRMVAFLHSADLHLGLKITRFPTDIAKRIREARFQALEKIREVAKTRPMDFALIAGDLFDDHAVDRDLARRAFDLLESFHVPVYVISGNHDPLLAGSVWDRPPWNQPAPNRIRILREPKPVPAGPGVTLFPCPVYRKTSLNDPTAWICEAPCQDGDIRIAIAHGSLRTRADLPPDDHLIARQAASDLKLDYLALGHWHSRQLFPDSNGVERTAYCGVHEPMRFPGSFDNRTGWTPYSSVKLDEFLDSGRGEVLYVRIDRTGAPPAVEPVLVGHLSWEDELIDVPNLEALSQVIDGVATRPATERRLLRLKLRGILELEARPRLQDLREVLDRYLFGELDETELHIHPSDEAIREMVGHGVLRRVLERLQEESRAEDPAARCIAERAMRLLYQIAHEVRT